VAKYLDKIDSSSVEAEQFQIGTLPFYDRGLCKYDEASSTWYIRPREWMVILSEGDWIVKRGGVEGLRYEWYPDDVFRKLFILLPETKAPAFDHQTDAITYALGPGNPYAQKDKAQQAQQATEQACEYGSTYKYPASHALDALARRTRDNWIEARLQSLREDVNYLLISRKRDRG
jgi:hypothetical protein